MGDFNTFLQDHAACEKKAHASALTLASHYRDKPELVTAMIELSLEELTHFQQVWALLEARGLPLGKDERDPYVTRLLPLVRRGSELYMLDRLLLFGVVEARGCERFGLIRDALPDGALKDFYTDITRSESRHHGVFVRLAKRYFDEEEVTARLDEFLTAETDVLGSLELRAALH